MHPLANHGFFEAVASQDGKNEESHECKDREQEGKSQENQHEDDQHGQSPGDAP